MIGKTYWSRMSGPVLTLPSIAVVELLMHIKVHIPDPVIVLYLNVVVLYAALSGRLRWGLVSGILTSLYLFYRFSIYGNIFHDTYENLWLAMVIVLASPAIALIVGISKRLAYRSFKASRANAVLQAQLIEHERGEAKQQRTDEALRESEANLRLLFAHNPMPTWILDMDSLQVLQVNDAAIASYGYSREEFLQLRITHIWPPEDVPRLLGMVKRDRSALLPPGQWRHRCKDGRIISVEIVSERLKFRDRIAALVVAQDINERQRANEAQRRSEADYPSLVECAPYGIYRASQNGKLLMVNPALVEMLGYASKAELLAANLATDIYRNPDERPRLVEQFRNQERLKGVEVEWKRKDGVPIRVKLSEWLVRDEHGGLVYFEAIIENVTERRAFEEQMQQLSGPVRENGREIENAADQAVTLTQQHLTLNRKELVQPKLLDLTAVVVDTQKRLRRLTGEGIELVTVLGTALGRVKVDPAQIEQVVLNLAANARDAMPYGGKLTIKTANVELDEAYARPHSVLSPGCYLMLEVSDTGCGMDAETQSHIFEPFFTTKDGDNAMGLGLATVCGFVKQSGGYILVCSEPGHGATFKIYLPRVKEDVEAAGPPQAMRNLS